MLATSAAVDFSWCCCCCYYGSSYAGCYRHSRLLFFFTVAKLVLLLSLLWRLLLLLMLLLLPQKLPKQTSWLLLCTWLVSLPATRSTCGLRLWLTPVYPAELLCPTSRRLTCTRVYAHLPCHKHLTHWHQCLTCCSQLSSPDRQAASPQHYKEHVIA